MSLSWADLQKYNYTNPPLVQLSRKKEVEQNYISHKEKLKRDTINIHDYIKKNIIGDRKYVFTQNQFPYNLESNIQHDLLWINPELDLDIESIYKLISNEYKSKKIVFFKNVSALQSIKSIIHYHIFVKIS